MKALSFVPLLLFSFTFTAARAVEEPIRLMAGGLASVSVVQKKKAELEKASGTEVQISTNPADIGMLALSRDTIDGFLGSKIEELLPLGEKRGMPRQNPDDYQMTPFASFYVKFALHPDNPATVLTKEQVADILAGKVTNWNPINGKNIPLKIFAGKNYINTNRVLFKYYTGADKNTVATEVLDRDGLLKAIKANPGAIGIFGTNEKLPDFSPKYIQSEAQHFTNLVTKKSARPAVQKLFNYIKSQPPTSAD